MTEEKKEEKLPEKPPEKAKQYLLMVDDLGMMLFNNITPKLQFIEVEGLTMKDSENYKILAHPLPKKDKLLEEKKEEK